MFLLMVARPRPACRLELQRSRPLLAFLTPTVTCGDGLLKSLKCDKMDMSGEHVVTTVREEP